MKFTLTAILAASATQLMGIDAAAQGLCKSNVIIHDEEALTQEHVTDYTEWYTHCTLRHYFSKCLTQQFHQRVSETEFVKQSYEGNPPTIEDGDLVFSGGSPPAHCTDSLNVIEMDLNVDYSGQTSYNPLTGQYGGSGRRNRLLYQIEEFGISALNQEALQDFDDKCGNYEVSELFVYIQNLIIICLHYSALNNTQCLRLLSFSMT